MLKKLNDKRGSILYESLITMMIVSLITTILLPAIIGMMSGVNNDKEEVEIWRFCYDSLIEASINDRVTGTTSRLSDNLQLTASIAKTKVSIYCQSVKGSRYETIYLE